MLSGGRGWEALHVALDDATRLVYAELLSGETGCTARIAPPHAEAPKPTQDTDGDGGSFDNGAGYLQQLRATA